MLWKFGIWSIIVIKQNPHSILYRYAYEHISSVINCIQKHKHIVHTTKAHYYSRMANKFDYIFHFNRWVCTPLRFVIVKVRTTAKSLSMFRIRIASGIEIWWYDHNAGFNKRIEDNEDKWWNAISQWNNELTIGSQIYSSYTYTQISKSDAF